jgi:hypothetical protein
LEDSIRRSGSRGYDVKERAVLMDERGEVTDGILFIIDYHATVIVWHSFIFYPEATSGFAQK